MLNTEQLAVNAVSDLIGKCPRLVDYLASNDKTPVTDGHIDLYNSAKHSKTTLVGRVPAQVKGSAGARKTKARRPNATFPVEREVLQFLRTDGGGLYFFVSMRPDGTKRQVFYSVLTPFKIDRIVNSMSPAQKSISIQLSRMPTATTEIERLVWLAWEGRKQGKVTGFDETLLTDARGFTIHSLADIPDDRPTVLNLEETDFAVTLHTAGGMSLPIDLDLTLYPSSYLPQEVSTPVSCGGIEFTRPVARQVEVGTLEIRLSDSLRLTVEEEPDGLHTAVDFAPAAGVRAQIKDLTFILAALRGEPLMVAHRAHVSKDPRAHDTSELEALRDRLARVSELFDALGLDDAFVDSLEFSLRDLRTLLVLHQALVRREEVAGSASGSGRYDFVIGDFKVVTVITPGTKADRTRIVDPFDPGSRALFRIYRVAEDDRVEELSKWGTAYEALDAAELVSALNLRLHQVTNAYAALEDRAGACATANAMVLNLLQAADSTGGAHRDYLLDGAESLCDWLIEHGDDGLVYKINKWQVRLRRGALSAAELKEIRSSRRALSTSRDEPLREACLTILLGDLEELVVILDDLPDADVDLLRSWPIWTLAQRRGADRSSMVGAPGLQLEEHRGQEDEPEL